MRTLCVGLSHKTAPLAVREALAFSPSRRESILADIRVRWSGAEFLLLCTCNRTELYTIRPRHGRPREEELRRALSEQATSPTDGLAEALYVHIDVNAVRHVFRVAAGLESLVPGESQIVSQIKQALAEADRAATAGARMAAMVAEALHVAKHVRSETPIAEGKVSVASVALDCIRRAFPTLRGKCVLNVGGGKMNELLLRQLDTLGPRRVIVANRSRRRAEEIAELCGAESAGLDDLPALLRLADVVVTSTAAEAPILSVEILRAAQQARNNAPLLIVDLAVPRDVAPAAKDLPGAELVDMDDLCAVVEATLDQRCEHVRAAETIVERHVQEYLRQTALRDVSPTIEALYRRVDDVLATALAEATNKLSTHDDQEEDLEVLRRALRRSLRQFCHPAVEALREETARGAGAAHAETLRRLFGLDTDME